MLAIYKKRIAAEINSRALRADALETLACSYLSLTLLIGLGANALLGWWWADPVAALAMVYFLVKEGWEAISEAVERRRKLIDCCEQLKWAGVHYKPNTIKGLTARIRRSRAYRKYALKHQNQRGHRGDEGERFGAGERRDRDCKRRQRSSILSGLRKL